MRLNFETEYFAISYHNRLCNNLRSYNCFTQEIEREKNQNNLEGKRINFAISLFTFLVASVESKRGGKQTRTRALQARISGYFH